MTRAPAADDQRRRRRRRSGGGRADGDGGDVASSEGPRTRASVQARRKDVVRRLLRRGISVRLLVLLLPEWRELVLEVAGEAGAGRADLRRVHG